MPPRNYQFDDYAEERERDAAETRRLTEERFKTAVDACKLMALKSGEGSTLHIAVEYERHYVLEGESPTVHVAMCNMISVLREPRDHEMRYTTCKLCNNKHQKALAEQGDSSW